jgi:hypothetical protein
MEKFSFETSEPLPAVTPAKNPYRLVHPDYYCIDNGTVRYTPAGLRLYTEQFGRHGLPLPLPVTPEAYIAAMWRLADALAGKALEDLQRDLPSMAMGEKAVAWGWLVNDADQRKLAATRITSARSTETLLRQAGANVTSLDLARVRQSQKRNRPRS